MLNGNKVIVSYYFQFKFRIVLASLNATFNGKEVDYG